MNIEKIQHVKNNYEMYNFLKTFGDEPVCRDSDYHRLKAWILFYLTILTSSPFRSSLRIFFSTSLRAIIT